MIGEQDMRREKKIESLFIISLDILYKSGWNEKVYKK
jgi:hypothetical protein